MAETAQGMLVVWMNVEPAQEADFDAWYTRQHVPERVGVPGFRNGARYASADADPRFLALYDVDSPDVLTSAPYRERLDHPTPWTQRVMTAFCDTVRVTARMLAERGQGTGGVVRTCRIEPAAGRRDDLRAALAGPLSEALYEQPGIARVRAVEAVETGTGGGTAETAIRGPDRSASFVLILDGHDAAALAAAGTALLSDAQWSAHGAQTPVPTGDYRLVYCLTR